MPATMAVRTKFYSKRAMIDDSASDYYAEQERQRWIAEEENARNCIIDGINPRTGATLTLEEHKRELEGFAVFDEEWDVYNVRLAQKRSQENADDRELADMINSQYPCTCCDGRLLLDPTSLNPAEALLVAIQTGQDHL
jgi:hypothetical protein